AGHGRDRADAVYGGEHAVRWWVSARRAELLEVELPRWALRRGHRRDDRPLRSRALADECALARTLPRRGHARGGDRHRLSAQNGGIQFPGRRGVAGCRDYPSQYRLGARGVWRDGAALRRGPLRQLSERG